MPFDAFTSSLDFVGVDDLEMAAGPDATLMENEGVDDFGAPPQGTRERACPYHTQ